MKKRVRGFYKGLSLIEVEGSCVRNGGACVVYPSFYFYNHYTTSPSLLFHIPLLVIVYLYTYLEIILYILYHLFILLIYNLPFEFF